MRVLILFSSSELGGAERSLTRMAMRPSGIEYHLATLDGEGPWSEWMRCSGRSALVFGQRNESVRHGQFGARSLTAMLHYVRREHISAIYVCGVRAAFILRWMKPVMPGVKIVQGVRWNPDSDSGLDRGFRLSERWFHGLLDGYITNSRVAVETLIRRCGIPASMVDVIYNGLADIPRDIPSIRNRPMEVLTVANLAPRKGILEYLEAVHLVLESVPDARFVLVGRDDMNGVVQRAIDAQGLSQTVSYEGFQADVTPYYSRARVVVLPSLWNEGCPTTLLESLAWGSPVVAYGIDGIPELVDNGVDGFHVPPRDVRGLAAHVINLLRNTTLAEDLGLSGRRKVAERFTIESCAHLHEKFFTDLCTARAAATQG